MVLENLTAGKVREQITAIEEQRKQLVSQAERQLAAIDGQLGTLRWLLTEERKSEETEER
jgi:hypothetical protein